MREPEPTLVRERAVMEAEAVVASVVAMERARVTAIPLGEHSCARFDKLWQSVLCGFVLTVFVCRVESSNSEE